MVSALGVTAFRLVTPSLPVSIREHRTTGVLPAAVVGVDATHVDPIHAFKDEMIFVPT